MRRDVAVVALCGLLVSASSMARAASPEPFEDLLERGSQMAEAGEHEAAAELLAAAYRAMPDAQKVGDFGRFVANEASRTCLQAANRAQAPREALERCEAFLAEYFDDLEAARARADATSEQDATEADLRHRLELVRARLRGAEPEEPAEPEPASPSVEPLPPSASVADQPGPRIDPTSVAMVTAGAVVFGAGVGLFVHGLRFPTLLDRARADALEVHGLDPSEEPPAWQAHADAQRPKGRALVGVGVAMVAVGLAAATWGTVRLVRQRRGTPRVGAAFGRGAGLLVIEGRLPAWGLGRTRGP